MIVEEKAKIWGIVASVIFLILLILTLSLWVLRNEIQPEEGLAVNLGDMNAGGEEMFEPTPVSEVPEVQNYQAPQPVAAPTPAPSSPAPEVPSQDLEETVNLNKQKEKKKKEDQAKTDAEAKKRKAEELQKKQELAKAQEEARQKAEAERQKKLEQQRKADEIKARMGNAFANKNGKNTDASTAGTGGGTTGGAKGSPNGGTGGTTGNATGGKGNRYSLEGRSISGSFIRPSYAAQEEGKVVVNITVDRSGNVIDAAVGRGTNTDNQSLRNAAIAAAKKTKFNAIDKGADRQVGTITYNFELK